MSFGDFFESQKWFLAMSVPFVIWVIVFCYVPIFGWIMAFQDFNLGGGFLDQSWVGLDNFTEIFSDSRFYEVLRNTLVIGGLNIAFTMAMAIFLAVAINEVRGNRYKKTVQSLTYLPHFISWVVVSSIVSMMLSRDGGVLNSILLGLGVISEPVSFMANGDAFWTIITVANVWKEAGWQSIVIMSAIVGIDQELYEAAAIDGVGRFGRIRYITLPSILPVVALLIVLAVGGILTNWSGFDPSFLLGNSVTRPYSDSMAVYSYRYGLELSRFSLGTAISIVNSIASILLLFAANRLGLLLTGSKVI